jgi:hypothetical protein
MKCAVYPRPVTQRIKRVARTRAEMERLPIFRCCVSGAHRTRAIRLHQPHSSEGDIRLTRHGVSNRREYGIERALLGDGEKDRRQ